MTLLEFETFMEETKSEFQRRLENSFTSDLEERDLEWLFKQFDMCSNNFEESTFMENLREVYISTRAAA